MDPMMVAFACIMVALDVIYIALLLRRTRRLNAREAGLSAPA
jgi:hypothetical protein